MRHVAHQLVGRVAWQLRIGIQGNNVPDQSKNGLVAYNVRKSHERLAPQQRVELLELAAFALVAHPHSLESVPQPWPVKKIKNTRAIVSVVLVERFDTRPSILDQRRVLGQCFLGCVVKIR